MLVVDQSASNEFVLSFLQLEILPFKNSVVLILGLAAMTIASRGSWLFSLGLMPLLMGLGHLAPAIGAIYAATGSYQFPVPLLGMIGSAAALVDCKLGVDVGRKIC